MKTPFIALFCMIALSIPSKAETYRYVDKAIVVDSLLERIDTKAVIIEPGNYKKSGKGLFDISLPEGAKAPDVVYLKKTLNWIYQSPAPSSAVALNKTGTLSLTSQPGQGAEFLSNGTWKPLTDKTIIVSGTTVRTPPATALTFAAPGIDSLRIDQASEFTFQQQKTAKGIQTKIELEKGTSFIRTLNKEGLIHDFSVSTPKSIAAARGTEYLVSHEKGVSVTCIIQGGVDVTTEKQKPVAELTVTRPSDLLFQAVPELNARQYSEWLYGMITRIQESNPETNTPRTFTGYLPVIRKGSHLKSAWEATNADRIKW